MPVALSRMRLSLCFAVVLSLAVPTAALAQGGLRLKIATRIVPPLVMPGADGQLTGFSVELWKAIAKNGGFAFDFDVKDNLPSLLAAVRNGEADAAIAAVSITSERERTFDFSQPVLESGLQVLVREPARDASVWDSLFTMLHSPALYELLAILIVLALIPVPFVWWAERRQGSDFVDPQSRTRGLFKAGWWSFATLAGQADEMPRSALGRAVAVLCMFASVLFISYFTAATTTLLTVRQLNHAIRGPGDLAGRAVGTVADSTAAGYLAAEGMRGVPYNRIEAALVDLDKGDVDAVVYDAPVIQYYAAHGGRGKALVVGNVFRKEDYGILLPPGSPLRKPINTALLALRESGGYRAIHANWFGQE